MPRAATVAVRPVAAARRRRSMICGETATGRAISGQLISNDRAGWCHRRDADVHGAGRGAVQGELLAARSTAGHRRADAADRMGDDRSSHGRSTGDVRQREVHRSAAVGAQARARHRRHAGAHHGGRRHRCRRIGLDGHRSTAPCRRVRVVGTHGVTVHRRRRVRGQLRSEQSDCSVASSTHRAGADGDVPGETHGQCGHATALRFHLRFCVRLISAPDLDGSTRWRRG